MAKYSDEQKAEALKNIEAIGVKKTSVEMKISAQTLYKWRREQNQSEPAPVDERIHDALDILEIDDGLTEKVSQLEAENAKLREIIAKLKKALLAFIE